jgi:probable F420-dependent oxidoreductase
MKKPFRFAVQIGRFQDPYWKQYLQKLEGLGYSAIFFPDHFGDQLEPLSAASAALSATTNLKAGTLVLDVDYRHPVVLAKSAATIQTLSGGRLEFGIGAGWMRSDYDQAGIEFDPPSLRVARLEEALQVISAIWSQDRVDFEGKHYRISGLAGEARAFDRAGCNAPAILIGGGGRRVLSLAGKYADIVGINPALREGRVTPTTAADLTPERARTKVDWVREAAEAAGRNSDAIEFSCLVFVLAIVDDPTPIRTAIASSTGMTADEVAACPLFLTGSAAEIKERLERQREETGISYVVIQDMQQTPPGTLEKFAEEIVSELAGN